METEKGKVLEIGLKIIFEIHDLRLQGLGIIITWVVLNAVVPEEILGNLATTRRRVEAGDDSTTHILLLLYAAKLLNQRLKKNRNRNKENRERNREKNQQREEGRSEKQIEEPHDGDVLIFPDNRRASAMEPHDGGSNGEAGERRCS